MYKRQERLTKESQNEQASAGLDNLTSEEYEQFNELNRSYREKYGFPFIIAVKNRSKSEILELLDYSSDNLVESIRVNTESAINNKTLTIQEARKLIDQIETSLRKSSYLSE